MSEPVFAAQPYSGIATFGRVPFASDSRGRDVAIVGVPYDGSVSYRSGTRFGPRAIREQSLLLWGYNNVQKIAPFKTLNIADLATSMSSHRIFARRIEKSNRRRLRLFRPGRR